MIVRVRFDLEIDEPHLVAAAPGSFADDLEPERLQSQENLGVHQGSGVNQQQLHQPIPSWSGRGPGR
jgi:hypothetical protein